MTHKLSPHKASRVMELYFQGRSQPEIAGRLKVDQRTVSLHVTRFKHLAGEKGLKAGGKEFNVAYCGHQLGSQRKDHEQGVPAFLGEFDSPPSPPQTRYPGAKRLGVLFHPAR